MPMIAAFTAAEIAAAAEAIALAEAAATAAAVAEAAAIAETAATAATAAETATVASAVAPNAGILGAEIGASVAPTAETAAAGLETISAGAESANAAQIAQQQAEVARQGFTQAELEALQRGQEMANLSSAAPPVEVTAYANPSGSPTSMLDPVGTSRFVPTTEAGVIPDPVAVDTSNVAMRLGDHNVQAHELLKANPVPAPAPPSPYGINSANPTFSNPAYRIPSPANMGGEGIKLGGSNLPTGGVDMGGAGGMSGSFPQPAAPTGLEAGFNKALQFAKDSPFSAGSMALNAFQYLGRKEEENEQPDEYNGILTKYKMSPDFKGRFADPQDYQYTPKMYNMAEGGIASYKRGDLVGKSSMDYYERMTKPAEKLDKGDAGIYYDLDPDTRYQDALTAAQVRMAKVNKRANLQVPSMKRPTPMGQLNLVPVTMKKSDESSNTVDAAQGGVMSLGGYAAGGNPRLLKGPGDGMSDNIPATIGDKQPARLADGEFVIPADVVSHLGNGSTEAGAKKLHKMMNDVRKARTGNSKQGKQINPNKFIPK